VPRHVREVAVDAHELEWKPHARRRRHRGWKVEPQFAQPVLDHAHRPSMPRRTDDASADARSALEPAGAEGAAIIESRSPAAVGAAGGEPRRYCGGTGFGSRPSLRRHTKAAESRDTEATEKRTPVNGT
jgi:hypothetical protein